MLEINLVVETVFAVMIAVVGIHALDVVILLTRELWSYDAAVILLTLEL